jgi:hypothetical protein
MYPEKKKKNLRQLQMLKKLKNLLQFQVVVLLEKMFAVQEVVLARQLERALLVHGYMVDVVKQLFRLPLLLKKIIQH